MDVEEGGHETEAGRGMEIEEEEAVGGVCKADMQFVDDEGGTAGGRTVLKGWDVKGGCDGAVG